MDDLEDMSPLWSRAVPKTTLTPDEQAALIRLEKTVQAGVTVTMTMLDAGKALAEIRSRQLYRDANPSWEDYVQSRFRITKRRADQMISFASVSEALEDAHREMGTAVPIFSERAARPLAGMSPEAIREVVAEAAAEPAGVTSETIRKAARRRKTKASKAHKPRRFKVPGAVVVVSWNRRGNGAVIDALAAALRQAEDDLERQAEAA